MPALVKILRKLLMAGYAPEYDVGGVTDPFLQSKILHLLRILGKGNASASEAMNNVLAQVATNTESLKNAGNAVLYEVVSTIMNVESESGLRVLAVNILGKFLSSKEANLKYVALETLTRVVHLDVGAVQRHRSVIVECLRDGDISIRKRALDLVYCLVNVDNVKPLVKELLSYLVRNAFMSLRSMLLIAACILHLTASVAALPDAYPILPSHAYRNSERMHSVCVMRALLHFCQCRPLRTLRRRQTCA